MRVENKVERERERIERETVSRETDVERERETE